MEEVIKLFNRNKVRYLLIGGQAVRLEGMPRFSMDWDFYVPPADLQNIKLINGLLASEIDTEILPLGKGGEHFVQTYQTRWGIIQFHLGGPGLPDFDDAERRSVIHKSETGLPIRCLCGKDLLETKRKANRPQDQSDIEFLEAKKKAGLL